MKGLGGSTGFVAVVMVVVFCAVLYAVATHITGHGDACSYRLSHPHLTLFDHVRLLVTGGDCTARP